MARAGSSRFEGSSDRTVPTERSRPENGSGDDAVGAREIEVDREAEVLPGGVQRGDELRSPQSDDLAVVQRCLGTHPDAASLHRDAAVFQRDALEVDLEVIARISSERAIDPDRDAAGRVDRLNVHCAVELRAERSPDRTQTRSGDLRRQPPTDLRRDRQHGCRRSLRPLRPSEPRAVRRQPTSQ